METLSIAPMIQWTDRYWRFLIRQITHQTLLYTEMTSDVSLVHNVNNFDDFLGHDPSVELPLAVQLGGSVPEQLAEAAYLCESYGAFHEININAGCPSTKAKRGGFGAELMLNPENMKQIIYAVKRRVSRTDVTVKCRIGVTGRDSKSELIEFISACKAGGVDRMIIHARKCELKGLSPAQNRSIPPLRHDVVHEMAEIFPDMNFILNGGITTFDEVDSHLSLDNPLYKTPVHGVMIGREAYRNIWMMVDADRRYFHKHKDRNSLKGNEIRLAHDRHLTRREVAYKYLDYALHCQEMDCFGSRTPNLAKPLHNFFVGYEESRSYKRRLDDLLKSEVPKGVSVDEIFWAAVQDTIPSHVLDDIV